MSGQDEAPGIQDLDPFNDLDQFRADPQEEQISVRKVLTRVPVRKPSNQEFFRVHDGEKYRMDARVLELKDDRETYFVAPHMRAELIDETKLVRLYTCVSKAGTVFLWAVPLPGPDGRRNGWHDSAHEAAALAQSEWTRIRADMPAQQYETSIAVATLADPTWPNLAFNDLIRLAFKDRLIDDWDHPVIRRLRGAE